MVRAYVLVKTGAASAASVQTALRRVDGVKSADLITGPYDVIAMVEVADMQALGKLVTERLGALSGVQDTLTCIAVS